MIFKTYKTDLDGINNKLGFSKRSFAEWGKQVSESFNNAGNRLSGFKEAFKTALMVPVKLEEIKLIEESDFSSAFPVKDAKSFFDKFNIKGSQSIATLTQWCNKLGVTDKTMRAYLIDCMQKQVPASFEEYNDYVQSAINNNKQLTISAKASKVALQALATVGNIAVSMLIVGGIKLVDNLIHKSEKEREKLEEIRQKSHELAESYKQEQSNLDSIVEKYKDLNEQLTNTSLTTEEYNSIKEQLFSLQDDLVAKYGEEASAIDVVNGKYDEQIKKLDTLSRQKAQDFVNESTSGVEEDWNFLNDTISIKNESALTKPLARVDDSHIRYNYEGTPEEIRKQINSDMNALRERYGNTNEYVNAVLKNLSELLKDERISSDQINQSKESLSTFHQASIDSNYEIKSAYDSLVDGIERYNNALETGRGVDEAYSNYEKLRGEFKNVSSDIIGIENLYDDLLNKINEPLNISYKLDTNIGNGNESTERYLNKLQGVTSDQLRSLNYDDLLSVNSLNNYEDAFGHLVKQLDVSEAGVDALIDRLIELGYIIDSVDVQNKENILNALGFNKNASSADAARRNMTANDVYNSLTDKQKNLLGDNLDLIPPESYNWTKEQWLNFIEELNNTAEVDITANPTKSLDSIKSAFSEFESIYEDIHNGSTVAASSIEKLNDAFGELDGGTALQEFKDVLTTMPDDIDAQQEALNKLATAYIDNSDLIKNLTEDNADYTISELKKMNVINAEEVVQSRLYNQEENLKKAQEEQKNAIDSLTNTISSSTSASDILTASKYKAMAASIDLENASANEVAGLINAANAAGVDSTALKNLLADKIYSSQIAITTNGDISNLISLCKALGGTVTYLEQYSQAKNIISQGGTLTGNGTADTQYLKGLKNLADSELKNALANYGGGNATNVQYTIPNSPSGSGSGGGTSKAEESKTQIDWISRHLEQLQKTIDKTKAKFENLFTVKKKSSNLDKQIKQTTALMKAQGKAADKYLAKAKEYAKTSELSTKLQKSVQSGRLKDYSLSDLIAEYGQDTADKINQYQDYWDKYQSAMQKKEELITDKRNLKEQKYQLYVDQATANLDRITAQAANAKDNYTTQNKYLDYQTKWIKQQYDYEIKIAKLTKDKTKVKQLEAEKEKALAQLEVSKFENISADYDHRIQDLTETMDKAGREIDQLEAAGKNVQASLYKSQRNTANSELKTYKEELKELEKQLKKIKEGTNEWYDAKSSIEKVKDAISKTTTTVYELNNAINELHFQLFEDKRTQISRIAQEYEFILGLAGDLKKVDEDTAQFTDMGYAELGVNSTDYYASLHNQNLDKQTLDELKSMLAKGILSNGNYAFNSVDDLRDKIDDLYDTWQSDIKTTYNYEKSLADAVSQKYQAQLNLAQKLTDERKEALQAEKNLHDYQRTISSQVKEINTLQMQISAYQGDTSQEGMAKLQALQKSLLEAQDELRETEYDRYISDQEDMLSSLYTEYEELISKKLDDFYGLVEEGLKIANEHSADIAYALTDIANTNQYTPQFNSVITAISKGQSIQQAISTDVNNILNVLTSSSGLEKIQGFSKGGVISSIEQQVKANGDSVLVSAQPGERILTRVQNENFEKLINSDLIKNPIMLTNMPDFSQYTKVSDFAKSGMGGGNVAININSIDLPNVINPENFGDELANQLQNNKKIQKLTQGITYNGMLGKSTNNVRHIH